MKKPKLLILMGSLVSILFFSFQNCGTSGIGADSPVSFTSTDSYEVQLDNGTPLGCKTEAQAAAASPDSFCVFSKLDYKGKACCMVPQVMATLFHLPKDNPFYKAVRSARSHGTKQVFACTENFDSYAQFQSCMGAPNSAGCPNISCVQLNGSEMLPQWLNGNGVIQGVKSVGFF